MTEADQTPQFPAERYPLLFETLGFATERLAQADWKASFEEIGCQLGSVLNLNRVLLFRLQPESLPLSASLLAEWAGSAGQAHDLPLERLAPEIPNITLSIWQTLCSGQFVAAQRLDAPAADLPTWDVLGAQSLAAVPLVVRGRSWGFLVCVDGLTARSWAHAELGILWMLALAFSSAIEHQILQLEMQVSRQNEAGLSQISEVITSKLDLLTILQTVLRLAAEMVHADACDLALVAQDGSITTIPYLLNIPEGVPLPALPRNRGQDWHTLVGNEPLMLDNYASHPAAQPDLVEAGVHALLVVPVISGELRLGTLALFNLAPTRHFNSHDLSLASAVGRQAGLTIQNARLVDDARRRAEESETLRQASAAVTTALDVNQVLAQILTHLKQMVDYDGSTVFAPEGGMLRAVATAGRVNREEVLGKSLPADNLLFSEMRQTRRAIILDDAQQDERFVKWGDWDTIHGWMGVPLIVRGEVMGYITLDSAQPGAFGEKDAVLAQLFADQAASALQNARLYEAAVSAAERRTVLHRASQEVSKALDPEMLYKAIHRAAAQLLSADTFLITLSDSDRTEIEVVYHIDRREQQEQKRLKFPFGKGISSYVIENGRTMRANCPEEFPDVQWVNMGDPRPVQSILAVPLRQPSGVAFGMVSAQSYVQNAYTKDDEEMLEMISAYAAIAMENTRLFGEVQYLAITDPLTEIFNRRHFMHLAEREIKRAERYGHPIAVIMMDIDQFKNVNDTYGHQAGDEVLRVVADRCRAGLREVDLLGRYGGEEFVILLPETSPSGAKLVAERMCKGVGDNPIPTEYGDVHVTASLGVAGLNSPGEIGLEKLLGRADTAMYDAKNTGRNRSNVWSMEME
jgi:diguanylate cyclase (GGDEF)-like protein